MGEVAVAIDVTRETGWQGTAGQLIQPEIILPGQFFDAASRFRVFEGEQRLMLAVLEDGLSCYMRYAHAIQGRSRRLFEEAEAWIFEGDSRWLFSFESICNVLAIDAHELRRKLQRWLQSRRTAGTETAGGFRRFRWRVGRRHQVCPPRVRKRLPGA